ncbi:MAG: hypothetical protein MZW92_62945 [Comamonadaceae bacterium]|nr:hypothetical protein [Comamonadaceae bacterium]
MAAGALGAGPGACWTRRRRTRASTTLDDAVARGAAARRCRWPPCPTGSPADPGRRRRSVARDGRPASSSSAGRSAWRACAEGCDRRPRRARAAGGRACACGWTRSAAP